MIRRIVRELGEWRRARRDYRVLCDEGRAAHLEVSIRIHSEDYEWIGLDGITGIKTTVPLTRAGKRYIRRIVRDIETTCVRAVLIANRKAKEGA